MTAIRQPFVLGLLLALLAACASPAGRESMAVAAAVPKAHPYTASVEVRGGAATGMLDSTNISSVDFKAAIEDSIVRSRLFRAIAPAGGGDYELVVTIVSLSKPSFGASMTVDLEAGWVLTRSSDKAVLLRKAIRSTDTTTMGDAMVGVTRGRLAVEGAARGNIAEGMKALAALAL